MKQLRLNICGLLVLSLCATQLYAADPPAGYNSLFNGKNLDGWKAPAGDNGHWKVVDGVIDYDAKSEAKGDKVLWSKKSFRNFILQVDWRLKKEKGFMHPVPIIKPDGSIAIGPDGKQKTVVINDVDSGIYLRGNAKSQVNIWPWPIGSGEVWGYRTDAKMPAKVRAGVTPKKRADRPIGEWSTFEIKMVGDRLWVKLNGEEVITNAKLPGVAKAGPIGLQHHGRWDAKKGQWVVSPSLVQFRNIYVKNLAEAE